MFIPSILILMLICGHACLDSSIIYCCFGTELSETDLEDFRECVEVLSAHISELKVYLSQFW